MRAAFDARRTRVALRSSGIEPPPLRSYFDRLMEFALAAEWGRRRISRARVAAPAAPRFEHMPVRARRGRPQLVLAE
jgi:hypothetical protein